MPKPHLVTIGVSHYCEKARWALDRAGVEYVESAHAPILHYAVSLARYGQRTTPILITPHGAVRDSTAILRHADGFVPADRRLFPVDGAELREVEELEERFDKRLGPATRRLAYFHLLQDPTGITRVSAPPVPAVERAALKVARPAVVAMLRRGLRIDAEGARRSQERIEAVFDEIDDRLADGRRYLVGNRFTAADLAFAALAAPILLPPEYGWVLPALEETPPPFRALVERYRARPAGALAMRLFREERGRAS